MAATGVGSSAAAHAVAYVVAHSLGDPLDPGMRVTVNFHPDRPAGAGGLVLEAMARDGRYRSQFETGTSNGGLTAHPGGDRCSWESRLFGGAYDDAPPIQRPTYGALNFRRRPVGGSGHPGSGPRTCDSPPKPSTGRRSATPTAPSDPPTSGSPPGWT